MSLHYSTSSLLLPKAETPPRAANQLLGDFGQQIRRLPNMHIRSEVNAINQRQGPLRNEKASIKAQLSLHEILLSNKKRQ